MKAAHCPSSRPSHPAGRLVASLVAEFLQFFHLDFTLAVFQPEASTVRVILTSPLKPLTPMSELLNSWKLALGNVMSCIKMFL